MKGHLTMGINQHSNVNLQGFELLRFFVPPGNLLLSQKSVFLTRSTFYTCCGGRKKNICSCKWVYMDLKKISLIFARIPVRLLLFHSFH